MSEFIRCMNCGDLSSYENTLFTNNTPLCTSCHEEIDYLLKPTENE